MSEKYLLYLTDTKITLHKGLSETVCSLEGKFEELHPQIKAYLLQTPKASIRLLVDRTYQDIREEMMPPLFIWDRLKFLHYKKEELSTQGSFFASRFFKQDGATYLRYIHISPKDALFPWLVWSRTLPLSFDGVFFVTLELKGLLRQYFPLKKEYQMVIYKQPENGTSHVIFKGERLLLSRLSQKKEDLKTSLHYLSRTYTDIYEKLQVLSFVKDLPFKPSLIKISENPEDLLAFLSSLKSPSLPVNLITKRSLAKKIAGLVLIFLLGIAGANFYLGIVSRNKALALLPEIQSLQAHFHQLASTLDHNYITRWHTPLDHYHFFQKKNLNPLKAVNLLFPLLNKHKIRLISLSWNHEIKLQIRISFFMKSKRRSQLFFDLEAFLRSCQEMFPNAKIHVLESPFESSSHELFYEPCENSLPKATVNIEIPC